MKNDDMNQDHLQKAIEANLDRKWDRDAVNKLSEPFNLAMIDAYKSVDKARSIAWDLFEPQPNDDVYYTLAHMHRKFKLMSDDLMKLHKGMTNSE